MNPQLTQRSFFVALVGVVLAGLLAIALALAMQPAAGAVSERSAVIAPEAPPATGGPDPYGYVYATVPYTWTDIAATGTRIVFSTLDDAVKLVNLPQTFWLYDLGSTSLFVGTNGYASLMSSSIYTRCDPATRQPRHALAPFCADLTVAGGNVYYQSTTFDGHAAFIVQYQDVTHKASGLKATFQIILDFADRSITYQYRSTPAGGAGGAAVGLIGSALNTADYLMACTGAAGCQPANGLALRFYVAPRPALALELTPSDFFPDPGDSLVYTFTLYNTGGLAAPAAAMTNSLPAGLDYTGGLTATAGVATYNAASREVRWRGDLAAGARVTLTYAAALNTADPVYATAVFSHPLAASPATALAAPADRWGAPELVAVPHFFDDALASARHLAVDAAGAAHVAYGGNGLFYATRPATGTWLLETIVTTPTVRPALLLDGTDHPVIVFSAGGKIMLARSGATTENVAQDAILRYTPDPAGWRIETIASGLAETSELARGSNGRLHVVYEYNRDLYYTAEGAAGWSAPTVVISPTGCTTYAGFSLALDAADTPYLACAYRPTSGNLRELRLFRGGGAAPWPTPEVIATNTESKSYDSPSLAFVGGEFHLAFTRNSAEVFYGRKTGGAWQISQIAQGGTLYDSYVSLDVKGGYVAVAYAFHNMPYPTYPTDIRLARRPLAGGAWTTENVESFAPGRDLPYPALAMDAASRGRLAYYDGADETLRYAAQTSAATSLRGAAFATKQSVPLVEIASAHTTGLAMTAVVGRSSVVGRPPSVLPDEPAAFTFETVDHAEILRTAALAVGEDGTVHLAYLAGGLRYAAHPSSAAGWTPQLVLPEADGTWLDLALSPAGAPHAAYARTGGPLYHATGPAASCQATPQAWTATIVDQPGNLQSSPAIAVDANAAPHLAYLALAGDGGRLLRHATLSAGHWHTETVATIGNATGIVPPPEIAALGGKVYLFYADCTAAGATGTYTIPLRLAVSTGAGWQTQTLDAFYGACDVNLSIRLRADEADGLVAVAETYSTAMRPFPFRRIFTLSPAGEVESATVSSLDGGSDNAVILSGSTNELSSRRDSSEESPPYDYSRLFAGSSPQPTSRGEPAAYDKSLRAVCAKQSLAYEKDCFASCLATAQDAPRNDGHFWGASCGVGWVTQSDSPEDCWSDAPAEVAAPFGPPSAYGVWGLVGPREGGIEYVNYDYTGAKLVTYQVTKDGMTYTSASVPVYQGAMITTDFSPIHRNGLDRSGGGAAVTETFYRDPTGTGTVQIQIPPPRRPQGCQIISQQEFVSPAPSNAPPPGDSPTCAVAPGSVPCKCGQESQTINAIYQPPCCGECGWNFYEWKGTCGGATGRTPVVNAACPVAGTCDVMAVWHRPLLGVSSTPAPSDFCASKQNSDKAALGFELCASSLDDWTVSTLTFQAAGSGKDDQEIEKVKLTLDGKTTESKYTSDDGTVIFTVGVEVNKGQCKAGSLTYTFKQLACPLCDDPVRKTGCKDAKDFSVTLPAANVVASARSYPRSLVIGSATGGPLKLQCIKNTNTSKYFYEIQKAIDDAATQNGHTIQVCPGTYTENVNVTKELTIRSTDGRSVTTVQAAEANDHVFEATRNNTTIQGFTAKGATGANKAGVYLGSAAAAAVTPSLLSGQVLSEWTTDEAARRGASEESRSAGDAAAHTSGLSMMDAAASPAAGVKDCKVLGNALQGNRYGILLDGATKNQIGGTAAGEGNVISGNSGDGVRIAGAAATDNKLLGNRIGTNAAGTGSAGNSGSGVWIGNGASRNVIGGTDVTPGSTCANSCNVIAYNAVDGVTVAAGTGNAIQGNSIHSNAKLGIDLGGDGWTRNGKTGGATPNNWQNYPVISGTLTLASSTLVTGTLTAKPNTAYRLEFFTNSVCETTGLVQGRELIATMEVTTDANGRVRINATLARAVQILTATATDPDGNTSEFSPPDIQITGVEVTQGIQNLKNEAPLVKDKVATVRVYVRGVGCDVPNVTADLLKAPGGILSPAGSVKAALGPDPRPSEAERADANASLNFVPPKSWLQGTDSWLVEVNPGCRSPDALCDEPNLFFLNDLTFQRAQTLDLRLVPIHYTRGGANLTPLDNEYEGYLRYFLALYPISRLTYRIEAPMDFDGDLTTPDGWNDLWNELKFHYRNAGESDTRVYGVLDDAVPYLDASGHGIQGIARVTKFLGTWWSRFAAGRVDANHGHWIMIHEVGHTFARPHPGCTSDEGPDDPAWPPSYSNCQIAPAGTTSYWGFDDANRQGKKPDTHSDFMTYAFLPGNGAKPTWVSEYTYRQLLEASTTTAAGNAASASAADGGSLAARGVVNLKTGGATFDFMYRLNEPGIPYEPSPGPYTLELQDVAGRAVVTHTFDLDNPHLPPDLEAAHFMEWLPYDTHTARIVLKRAGTELAARIVSANTPTVTLTYPNGGEVLTGTVAVRWTAHDADGDPMRYLVEYSNDSGATWRTLAAGLDQLSFTVNTADLPGGDRSLFRVLATDGVNTAGDQSNGFFTVGRKPPSVVIASPEKGAKIPADYPLRLWGLGADPEDGSLADAALSWTDSISGTLGIGGDVELPQGLGRGWHSITLTAHDSDGMTGADSVQVCVGCTALYLPVILR